MVFPAPEFAIPVQSELVVAEFSRISNEKGFRSEAWCVRGYAGEQRIQITSGLRAELIALCLQQIKGHGIYAGHSAVGLHRCHGLAVRQRNVRNAWVARNVDVGSRRIAAAL